MKFRSWKSIKNAMSDFGVSRWRRVLILCRCWGFAAGGLSVNNNDNWNNNGVGCVRKFYSLISLGVFAPSEIRT